MISWKPNEVSRPLKIDSWLSIFDTIVYYELGIVVSIFVTFLTLFTICLTSTMTRKRSRYTYRAMKKIWNIAASELWNIFQLIVGIYSFHTPIYASKVLVTAFTMSMFFLVWGLFGSSTSTDMVAMKKPPFIDPVSRLLNDDTFRSTDLIIPSGLWQELALKNARPGTRESGLWKRVKKKKFPFKMDTSAVGLLTSLYEQEVKTMRSVGGIDQTVAAMGKSLGCQMLGIEAKNLHKCLDTFAENILLFIVSKSSDELLVRWVDYYYIKVFESGWFNEIFRRGATSFKVRGDVSIGNIIICMENVGDDSTLPDPISLVFISRAFYLILWGTFIGSIVISFEIVIYKLLNLIQS